jgi:hypothetical protein
MNCETGGSSKRPGRLPKHLNILAALREVSGQTVPATGLRGDRFVADSPLEERGFEPFPPKGETSRPLRLSE